MEPVHEQADHIQYDKRGEHCHGDAVVRIPERAAAQRGQKDGRKPPDGADEDPVGHLHVGEPHEIRQDVLGGSRD